MQHAPTGFQIFATPGDSRFCGWGAIAGGVGCFIVAAGAFFLALRIDPDMMGLHAMTTLPCLLGIGLISAGITGLRAPRSVHVSDDGLIVLGRHGEFGRWRWNEIAFAQLGTTTMSHKRALKVHGTNRRVLVTLSADIDNFDGMVAAIQHGIATHPAPQATNEKLRKARRTGVFLMLGGVVAWALAGVNLWMGLSDHADAELLKSQGKPAQAVVTRKFVAPDGRTHRIEYQIADAGSNAPIENVEIDPMLWTLLETGRRTDAIAVPGRPDISRLTLGQVDDKMKPNFNLMIIMCIAITAFGLLFFVTGLLNVLGRDLTFTAGQLKLRRIGDASANARAVSE